MANHTGYIFVSPTGMYLTRAPNRSGYGAAAWKMGLNVHLDMAEIFPSENLQPGGCAYSWDRVNEALGCCNAQASIEQLTVLPAVSHQKVTIGHPDER